MSWTTSVPYETQQDD